MAKKKQNTGISPAGKIAILLVIFGIPLMFALSSWGLGKVYDIAPVALIGILMIICTVYTIYTAGLMYKFYEVKPPILRFVPCIGELSLMDVKYHIPCYILYALTLVFGIVALLPYSVLSVLGSDFATSVPFYALLCALVCLGIVQIIKGIGLKGCMQDIGVEWHKQMRTDIGVYSKFIPLGFIPFVRVMLLYALNKPLSTLVTFMNRTVEDSEEDNGFVAEDE